MLDVAVIEDPAAAEASLDPARSRILAALAEPGSAATLAVRLGLTRLGGSGVAAAALSVQLSASTISTGSPASGACNTPSARTPDRLRPEPGRLSGTSVDQDRTVPIPPPSSPPAGPGTTAAAGAVRWPGAGPDVSGWSHMNWFSD
ncbi:hypothetical protein ACIQGO_34280 [Streptomyces shenzhenensis]|uniref:hypothetical protein n=1 Tax=Streptomyces shenzhenensis TaxID=943815 RepID=UPI003821BE68